MGAASPVPQSTQSARTRAWAQRRLATISQVQKGNNTDDAAHQLEEDSDIGVLSPLPHLTLTHAHTDRHTHTHTFSLFAALSLSLCCSSFSLSFSLLLLPLSLCRSCSHYGESFGVRLPVLSCL